jgi:hypothetical protein
MNSPRYYRWVRDVYDALELYIAPEAGARLEAGRYTNVNFSDVSTGVGGGVSDGYARFQITLDEGLRCEAIFCWKREPTTAFVARRLIDAYDQLRNPGAHRPLRLPNDIDDLLKDIRSPRR